MVTASLTTNDEFTPLVHHQGKPPPPPVPNLRMLTPRKWRYTWETLPHIPNLRLFLFTHNINPINKFNNLKVSFHSERSLLLVTWTQEITDYALKIPVPRVLVDLNAPLDFKLMEDHIEVKLVMLLSVDHPLFINFNSVLHIVDNEESPVSSFDLPHPLSVHSDLKCLSSHDEVHLFCKRCSTQLTKNPLRSFVEMPSANWREVADNWFGSCCCSFGGIAEKLVNHYATSYLFSKGTCLLDASSVVLSYDDLAEHVIPDCFDQSKENGCACYPLNITESVMASGSNGRQSLYSEDQFESTSPNSKSLTLPQVFDGTSEADDNISHVYLRNERLTPNLESERKNNVESSPTILPTWLDISSNIAPADTVIANNWDHCCSDKTDNVLIQDTKKCCSHDIFAKVSKDGDDTECIRPLKNQNPHLNISLGNGFMVRNPNLSKDVDWNELRCPQCLSVLGAYPSTRNVHAAADGGVRLFKCYTSTASSIGGSEDIFGNYTLDKMFLDQLKESASDDLSFRTLVRDLKTRSPLLQIVLLNSDAWSCTGYCLEMEDTARTVQKIDLHPVVKVLFYDCSKPTESQLRMVEEWATKNQADEVFMLRDQVHDLIESLESATSMLPLSCSFMQGLSLSSIEQ